MHFKKGAAGAAFKGLVEGGTGGDTERKGVPRKPTGRRKRAHRGCQNCTVRWPLSLRAVRGFYKEAMVLDIPYLFGNGLVAWTVMDGPFGEAMAADVLQKTGMRVLAYGETGFRNFTNSSRPIKSPAGMKGMKIRVMETPVYVNMVKALGAAPTPIAWSEVYTALQQKVVDGQENPVATIVQAKLNEVQKYLTLDGHSYGCDFFLINDKFFKSLPEETQQIIKTSTKEAALIGRGIQTLVSATGVSDLAAKGMQIYTPNKAEMAQFKAATQKPVMDYVESQIGKTWIDRLLKAVKDAETDLAKD